MWLIQDSFSHVLSRKHADSEVIIKFQGKKYKGNIFSVIQQLYFETDKTPGKSIDLGIFLNGIPLFTAELKELFTGQNINDAIKQYRVTRDPRLTLFTFRRCLAHFAVDDDNVYMTTKLEGKNTNFIPFNKGHDRGAGNPPNHNGYTTDYLWKEIWEKKSLLNIKSSAKYAGIWCLTHTQK